MRNFLLSPTTGEIDDPMVPLLAQARSEIPEKYPGEGYALRSIADWLNNQDPPIPAKGGGRWLPTQISRLLQTHISLIEDIEKQFELEVQVRAYVRATPGYPDRERVLANLAEIELKREDAIREAGQLGADLAGTTYAANAVPMPQFYRADPNPASTHLNRELERADRRLAQIEERTSEEWTKAKAEWALVAQDLQKLGGNASGIVAGLSLADPRQQNLIERQRKVDAIQLRIALRREATRRVKKPYNENARHSMKRRKAMLSATPATLRDRPYPMHSPVLYHGNCLDVMHGIEAGSVDLILADLPYGTTRSEGDIELPLDRLWKHYRRVLKPTGSVILFASQPFTTKLAASNFEWLKYALVWEKNQPSGFLHAKNKPLKLHEDADSEVIARGVPI